jgi:large repetitive protein
VTSSGILKNRCLQFLAITTVLVLALSPARALAFSVNVVDPTGAPVHGFRLLVEEDTTHDPAPGDHKLVVPGDPAQNTLAISLHRSHAPVIASGESAGNTAAVETLADGVTPLPPGRYVVSVLPYFRAGPVSSFTMGGASIDTRKSGAVTVVVTPNPIETAQIAIKVFHDIAPVNNAPDVTEPGLAGFGVKLFDMAGEVSQDAFGNALGTAYLQNPDGTYDLSCDGNPCMDPASSGPLRTDANGEVIVRFLRPNKYGIQVVPPLGEGWYQTTTIEGTKTIDAWVRPKEPPFLVEFGPPFWHAFYGFVKEMDRLDEIAPPGPRTTVMGQVRKGHTSRPPAITFFNGAPPSTSRCLIGLNSLETGTGDAVWIGKCADEGFFAIPNVPPGTYQLVIWDQFLDHIISFNTVITPATGGVMDLGPIATPMWFAEHEHFVFNDLNENGRRDNGEEGIFDQAINLRFRDGTIYQSFPTDLGGYVPFEEVFPFFHWQVAEVDFARKKATGVTVVVDDGGEVTDDEFGQGKRRPQPQAIDGSDESNVSTDSRYRTELGPVLLQAFQNFAGQNLRFEWGKKDYVGEENGGISGIVFYATTRAENDPRLAAGDPWEPGIPRVQVNLYADNLSNETGFPVFDANGNPGDGVVDPADPTSATWPHTPVLADVDNYPLGWAEGAASRGPEDLDRNGNGVFDLGDAIRIAHSDSWDDNLPAGCRGDAAPVVVHGTPVPIADCAEGLRTWNQVRPGVFDGGWAFGEPGGQAPLPKGGYIVETGLPPGYEHVKEEDRNVDFGETPVPFLLPAECVGEVREVPPYLSFLTVGSDGYTLFDEIFSANAAAPFAGQQRPLCDRKKVVLKPGQNTAVDFFMFTDVPKAARAVGLITDDLANELAPGKPAFTEKFSPGWLPIAIFDYSDREIARTYSDEFGAYNFLVPSTYSIDLPTPSGVGPTMHRLCLNHPGPIPNPDFGVVPGAPAFKSDPRFKPQYSTTCYNFNYETGRTTYLDTPVIRTAAFVGPLQSTLDCELANGTPILSEFIGGPLISGAGGTTFTIRSVGTVDVPNPAYPGGMDPPAVPEFIHRDFGFGATAGTVRVGNYTFPAAAVAWTNEAITVTVPADAVSLGLATGQLTVLRANGRSTLTAVTLTVGASGGMVWRVGATRPIKKIQDAVDVANNGDLILVDPGTYHENVIVYKRVRIQGAGAWSTVINAIHYPGDALQRWREKLAELAAPTCVLPSDGLSCIGLLEGQSELDPLFRAQEGPGFLVIPAMGRFNTGARARIDGFTIRGADLGGGIFVNAYASRLQLLNNRLINNLGSYGGGIRIGNPEVAVVAGAPQVVGPSPNPSIQISFNHILQNGSLDKGGGISLYAGADGYQVSLNSLCGNFSRFGGGGISHLGLSNAGLIERNEILFNEVFQGNEIGGGGGGIELAGEPDPAGGLTQGAGNVTIQRNLIQGNLGGAADGGGIALRFVNGQDVAANRTRPARWHRVDIDRNVIVNNVTGLAGGGISLQDAARAAITRNTIANSDSAATAIDAFQAGTTEPTTPQVAGIVSRPHSALLAAASGQASSVPVDLSRNIVWHSRSFYWDPAATPNLQPNPAGPYQDLSPGLTCTECFLSANGDPQFVSPYVNAIVTAAAADEGGNFVQVLFTPLARTGNYTATAAGPAGASGPIGVP